MNSRLWADVFLSDHWWILFEIIFPSDQAKAAVSVRWRSFHEEAGETCSSVFLPPLVFLLPHTHKHSEWSESPLYIHFRFNCTFKIRTKRGARSLPWIHKDIHSLKRQCRRAERRRKKVNLQLRHQEMKAWTTAFNEQVKEARAGYFSPLIHSNKHSPELFGAQWSVFEILQVFIRLRHRVRNVFTF